MNVSTLPGFSDHDVVVIIAYTKPSTLPGLSEHDVVAIKAYTKPSGLSNHDVVAIKNPLHYLASVTMM